MLQSDFGGSENLFNALKTDVLRGLDGTPIDLNRRRQDHGRNTRHVREV